MRQRASGIDLRAGTTRSAPGRLVAALALGLTATATTFAADHPPLVSVDATTCATCHEDLLDAGPFVHAAAADDCTTCHDVSIAEGVTRVTPTDAEPALCLMCHDELTGAVEGEVESPHFPVSESCLTCHDPHASANEHVLLAPATELCATCHDRSDLEAPHGGQLTSSTDCAGCHQPHGSGAEHMLLSEKLHAPFGSGSCGGCHRAPFGDRIRLRARGERLCTACHGDVTESAGEGAVVHAALRSERGQGGCVSCHDPHMSSAGKLLVESGPELCGPCHGEIVEAAEAENGHAAASDDCLSCHEAHAASEAHLLVAPPDELCGTCHDFEDAELVGVHLGAGLGSLDCLSCHDAHGSGNAKLLARNVHAPLADGCDTCHEGSFDAVMEGGESALCLICHEEVGEQAGQAEVPHAAMEMARCVDCHNAHASAQRRLVKLPGGGECITCHEEQGPGTGEVAHGVIELIGCEACHEPHGGGQPKLLRIVGDELCLSCHDPDRLEIPSDDSPVMLLGRFPVPADLAETSASLRLSPDGDRGHPLREHRVKGVATEVERRRTKTTFEGELGCLSCHDPHKGRSKTILRWNAASSMEACIHCHPK